MPTTLELRVADLADDVREYYHRKNNGMRGAKLYYGLQYISDGEQARYLARIVSILQAPEPR